jgi:hypothetical protein
MNRFGKGAAIAYGFFPGWLYWNTHNREDSARLPHLWGKVQRDLLVAPARLANTPKPVELNQEVVEACRIDSPSGIAIVLLNWTYTPIPALKVTVQGVRGFPNTRSAQGASLKLSHLDDTVTVELPLEYVDVLLIEWHSRSPESASSSSRD